MSFSQTTMQTGIENQRLAQAIDHTQLTFSEGEDETAAIVTLCGEAREAGFFAVCVRPRHVSVARTSLAGSPVQVATVIGFPDHKVTLTDERLRPTVGDIATAHKVAETKQAIQDGADELDLVINVAVLKRDMQTGTCQVRDELRAIAKVAQGRPIKVILEIDLLDESEIRQATIWCSETGMAMVKTSTGMVDGGQGATVEAVRLIADTLRQRDDTRIGIKASGGIKTRQQALAFLDAGATRLGTSSGMTLMQGVAVSDPTAY